MRQKALQRRCEKLGHGRNEVHGERRSGPVVEDVTALRIFLFAKSVETNHTVKCNVRTDRFFMTINDVCSICLESIEDDDVLGRFKTECGHVFHTVCLQRHKGQVIIDAEKNEEGCYITRDHPGLHCPNCRTHLKEDQPTRTSPIPWYSNPPSQVALDAMLGMYTQRHKSDRTSRRDEHKLCFVQTTAERARTRAGFAWHLKAQQDAQRAVASVDRRDQSGAYKAYKELSRSTARMLEFYLQSTDWSQAEYRPLIQSQLQTYGLDTTVVQSRV